VRIPGETQGRRAYAHYAEHFAQRGSRVCKVEKRISVIRTKVDAAEMHQAERSNIHITNKIIL